MGAYNRNNYREKKERMPLKDENESYLYQTICRVQREFDNDDDQTYQKVRNLYYYAGKY